MAWKGITNLKPVRKRENEAIDILIKRFKKRVAREEILDTYRKRQYYVSPGEKRRRKHITHLSRIKKSDKRLSQF